MSFGRREFLLRSPSVLAALGLGACAAHAAEEEPAEPKASSPQGAGYDAFACSAAPAAHVLDLDDQHADALRAALVMAGFEARRLSRDDSPARLRGLLVIPAYASDSAEYATYMERYASDLNEFVDGANVLLQLTQDAIREVSPLFLPTTHTARRGTSEIDVVRALSPDHPLLANVDIDGDALLVASMPGIAQHPFAAQDGFELVLSDASGRQGVLLDGAYGQGRLLLAALELAPDSVGAVDALRERLLANLFDYVRDVCARVAPELSLAESEVTTRLTPGSSMIAVLPDTQVYSLRLPGLYDAQTSWLRNNARRLDIRYALALGDITNNNTRQEWERAAAAMSLLAGAVPLALVPGNHDYGPSGDASTRETKLNDYFSFASTAAMPSFGGAYEEGRLDNTFHLFEIGRRSFVLLALEWGPRDEVIAWANEVMEGFPEREGVLATHAYLNNDSRRYDWRDSEHAQRFNPHEYATPGGVNDGEELWQKLVRRHRFAFTLNGHVLGSGVGYLASVTDRGNTCHQMLSNFQMREQGGEGYMRLLEFMPDGDTVNVFTYSPLYDKFLDEPDQNFTIALDPAR